MSKSSVRDRLKAHRDLKQGETTVTLKETGIACTVPDFINHGRWMAAQRIAAGDAAKAQLAFVAEAVRFDGEKLTLTDIEELVPAGDVLQLIRAVFRSDASSGNGPPGNREATAH